MVSVRMTPDPIHHSSLLPQRIRATVDSVERRRLLMDLSINMRSLDCPYTVTYYGALFREVGYI